MALNPQYDAIGQAFAQSYYSMFDDQSQRGNLVNLYNVTTLYYVLYAYVVYLTFFISLMTRLSHP